jgi:hypothetical protein
LEIGSAPSANNHRVRDGQQALAAVRGEAQNGENQR